MSSTLVPYTDAMRLGQGFNSYTQDICINGAVEFKAKDKEAVSQSSPNHTTTPVTAPAKATTNGFTPSKDGEKAVSQPISVTKETLLPSTRNPKQIVTFSSRAVDNLADIMDALNISSSASIKEGTISASGSASFVNENKVSQSDINFLVTVKVTSQTEPNSDDMELNSDLTEMMGGKKGSEFTDVFGDCFIAGFEEGGKFAAIVSIKVNSKSRVKQVKLAASAQLAIPAVPGLTVGTENKFEKDHNDAFKDTETSISVNWSGGGDILGKDQVWDLPTVVYVANKFPAMVADFPERTSAVLMKYTSLKSFHKENAKRAGPDRLFVNDYSLCSQYTMDLFSAYMVYKKIWAEIADMIANPGDYKTLESTSTGAPPIKTDTLSLNKARRECRGAMIQILDETRRLVSNPKIADVDSEGLSPDLPCKVPGLLASRLPYNIRLSATIGSAELDSPEEWATVGKWNGHPSLHLSALVGDFHTPTTMDTFERGENHLFCTLNVGSNTTNTVLPTLTRVRIYAHEHHHGTILHHQHSHDSKGYVSALGHSIAESNFPSRDKDDCQFHIGQPTDNISYRSGPADLKSLPDGVAKVIVEYFQGSRRIAGLILLDGSGNEIISWRQYNRADATSQEGMKSETQIPPKGYMLVGFWGRMDAIVVTQIGAIWRKI